MTDQSVHDTLDNFLLVDYTGAKKAQAKVNKACLATVFEAGGSL